MSDIPPRSRSLSETERQAFQRLGLTPGHWAALGPVPLFYRTGLRAPNRRAPVDRVATERLRHALREREELDEEAAYFWERLGDGTRRTEAALAARLLAWHLATDLPFVRRVNYFQLLRQVAEHFVARGPASPRAPAEAVLLFRWLVDAYLPHPAFLGDTDPPPIPIAVPDAGTLDRLADSVYLEFVPCWPPLGPAEVARRMPVVVRVMGEPVREWWGNCDPTRRAAEQGLASLPFEMRQRVLAEMAGEWQRAMNGSSHWPNAQEFAWQLVNRTCEWVDAVRRAVRADAPAPEPAESGEPPAAVVEPAPEPPAEPPPVKETPAPAAQPPARPKPERVTAAVAGPFAPVSFDAALARARATSVADVCAWVESGPRLLFDDAREDASRAVAVVRDPAAVPAALWVVGDVHADILALANIVAHAEALATPERPPHFLFLGDFVDRGIHDHETLLFLFHLTMDHPDRVCVVPGNHDIDLQYDEAAGQFRVTIEPAEYCESLNAALAANAPDAGERAALARAFIRFCAGRPKAVFLPDGTLFAHGGFPHTDAQKEVATPADLCRPRCVDDFLWARIAESARVKRPNRGSRGHEFGWDTLLQFTKLAAEKLDIPVRRLVRGHDHVPDRWQQYPEYADNGVPVLTLNAMGRLLDGESPRRDGRAHPFPAVGRWAPDRLPEVVLLPLDPAEVGRAFAKPAPAGAEGGP